MKLRKQKLDTLLTIWRLKGKNHQSFKSIKSNFQNISCNRSISNVKVGEEIINTLKDIAETFNNNFASVCE